MSLKAEKLKLGWAVVAIATVLCIYVQPKAYAQGALDQATPTDNIGSLLDGESGQITDDPPAENPATVNPTVANPSGNSPVVSGATPASASQLDATGRTTSSSATVPEIGADIDDIPVGDFASPPAANDFAGAPEMPGTMRTLADGEAPEEYTIEEGDTLIDICDQLLDEPGYWPKLWALNPEIKNPHFIFPLMRLRFYPGDDETPPYLQVVTEEDVVPIDKESLEEKQLIAEKVEAAERMAAAKVNNVGMSPEKIVTRVLRAFERVFADVIGPDQVEPLAEQPLMGGNVFDATTMTIHLPGFIYGSEIEPQGRALVGRQGQFDAQQYDEVIVEDEKGLQVGTTYTVLRPTGMVTSPATGDAVGYRYEYIANIKIQKKVAEGRFRGEVQESRLTVRQDDLLVPVINTTRVIPISNDSVPMRVDQSVIVGWENEFQQNGGRGNYAFIDKGRGSGVAVGAYLPIYSTPGNFLGAAGGLDDIVDYKMVGVMRVVDVTDVAAVGFVVNNATELRIGDLTYKP